MLRLMKITLEIPSLACSRCSAEAPVRPQVLYPNAPIDPAFSSPLSEMYRIRPDAEVVALDDAGQSWRVILASRPIGWTDLPTGEKGTLCGDCSAAWHNTTKAFMIPPPPPVVEALVIADESGEAPAEPNYSGNKPSPFKPMVGAHLGTSPFQQPAGTKVSGPQNIIYGKPGSPNNTSIKR
jgi:hypothetical protein